MCINHKQEIESRVRKFFKLLRIKYNLTTSLGCRKEISRHLEWASGFHVDAELGDLIKESGLEYIGGGASRIVLSYGDFAIKIEKWSDDETFEGKTMPSQNLAELENYNRVNLDWNLRLLVVPILHTFRVMSRLVLVYPKLLTYNDIECSLDEVFANNYNQKKEAVILNYFNDPGEYNSGVYKGEIFQIDYNIEYDNDYTPEFKDARKIWLKEKIRLKKSRGYIREMERML